MLHPDELHDGRAGSDAGFYVDPALIGEALGGPCPLPFVREPICDDRRLLAAIGQALADLDLPLEDLQHDQIVAGLARALAEADRSAPQRPLSSLDRRAVRRARDHLDAGYARTVQSSELEAVTGLGRYALARHFRACLGTSPYRYLVMRRLDRARALIASGAPFVRGGARRRLCRSEPPDPPFQAGIRSGAGALGGAGPGPTDRRGLLSPQRTSPACQ